MNKKHLISNDIIKNIINYLESTYLRIAIIVFNKYINYEDYVNCVYVMHTKYLTSKELIIWGINNGCPRSSELTSKAAMYGSIELIEYVIDHGCTWNNRNVSVNVVKSGSLQLLQYIFDHGCLWNEYTCYEAARLGRLDMLAFMHSNGCKWNKHVFMIAAEKGYVDIIEYAHNNNCEFDNEVINIAFKYGQINVIKFFHTHNYKMSFVHTLYAARNGHLDAIKYYYSNIYNGSFTKYEFSNNIMFYAIKSKNIELIKWLINHNAPLSVGHFIESVKDNDTLIIKTIYRYAKSLLIPNLFNRNLISIAVLHNNIDVLKFLLRNGCRYHNDICNTATQVGYLECLRYLHTFGCPIYSDTIYYSALNGHVNCLKYLHTNKCQYDKELLLRIANSQDCIEYITTNM